MKLVLSYFFSIVKVTLSNVDFVFDTVSILVGSESLSFFLIIMIHERPHLCLGAIFVVTVTSDDQQIISEPVRIY